MKWTVSSRNRNSGCIPFGGDYILSVSLMNPGSTSILVKSRCMTLLLLQRAGLLSESQNLQKKRKPFGPGTWSWSIKALRLGRIEAGLSRPRWAASHWFLVNGLEYLPKPCEFQLNILYPILEIRGKGLDSAMLDSTCMLAEGNTSRGS